MDKVEENQNIKDISPSNILQIFSPPEVPTKTRNLKCPDRLTLEPGCAIINGKCKCMGWSQACQSTGLRWDFKNLEVNFAAESLRVPSK